MISTRNRAARRHNRQLKIRKSVKYLARILPGATYAQACMRARHPKCDVFASRNDQLERHLFNVREDRRVERILREQLLDVPMCTDGVNVFYKRMK